MVEKRSYSRFELCLDVRIHSDQPAGDTTYIQASTRDVSAGGAFVLTSAPFQPGTSMSLEILMPEPRSQDRKTVKSIIVGQGTVLRRESHGFAVCFDRQCKLFPAADFQGVPLAGYKV